MENENTNVNVINDDELEKDFHQNVRPHIHNIGQATMLIGLVLMLLPAVVMYFICGWKDIPVSTYAAFIAFWIPFMGISQLFGHLRFYPMMGAACTYISYIAGNAETMRVPVANSCATEFDTEVLSARGQIVAIIGVATSVVANIGVLLIIIFFGEAILSVFPDIVRTTLGYITYAIFGYLLATQFRILGKGNVPKGITGSWIWIAIGLACRFVYKNLLQSSQHILLTLFTAVVIGFILDKVKEKRVTVNGANSN